MGTQTIGWSSLTDSATGLKLIQDQYNAQNSQYYYYPTLPSCTTTYIPFAQEVVVDKTKAVIKKIEALMEAGFLREDLSVKDLIKLLGLLSD